MLISSISPFHLGSVTPIEFDSKSTVNNKNSYQNDVFVKKTSAISFGKMSEEKKEKVIDALKVAGFVGTPFLAILGAAGALAIGMSPNEIFFDGSMYYTDPLKISFKARNIRVDSDAGLFQIKKAGIDINPERFDYIDTNKGIYRNYSKGIDIDLLHGKYVDPENGVFMDPENGISALKNANGVLEEVILPSFKGASPIGGESAGWFDFDKASYMTRNEFIDKFGATPESMVNDGKVSWHPHYDFMEMPDGKYVAIDSRSFLQKFLDFFNPNKAVDDISSPKYDFYGRRILYKKDGKDILADKEIQQIIDKHRITGDDNVIQAAKILHEEKLREYITSKHPECSNLLPRPSFEEFDSFIGRSGEKKSFDPQKLIQDYKDFTSGRHSASFKAHGENEDIIDALATTGKKVDMKSVENIIQQIEDGKEVSFEPNSSEALNFALFQKQMIEDGEISEPLIAWDELIDKDTISDALESFANSDTADDIADFLRTLIEDNA